MATQNLNNTALALRAVTASTTPQAIALPLDDVEQAERKARHLRSLINVLACDGGERLADELTPDTRGDVLECLEDLATELQALTARS